MQDTKDIVTHIWKSHQNYLADQSIQLDSVAPLEHLGGLFCPGPFYYYIIDSPTLTFDLASDTVREIFGVEPQEFSLANLIERIHPDDVPFFLRCEDTVAYFLKNCIAPEQVSKYKICYCLRQKVSNGDYHLFMIQTITLRTTPDGALLKVLGIHTDINHITELNNYKLSLIGLDDEPSFLDIDTLSNKVFRNFVPFGYASPAISFTRREMEVLRLIGRGMSTVEIAAVLQISKLTVTTHRKNLIRKAGCKNSVELVVECVRKGYI